MSDEQMDQYPHVQLSLLAMRRYYEFARDEQFKWDFVDFPKANAGHALPSLGPQLLQDEKQYGLITKPASMLLPALAAIRNAQVRVDQQVAMLQTVEAIRHYAAHHSGRLPPKLADTKLPSPDDPVSGKPFLYELQQHQATLTGLPSSGHLQYKLILRIAK